MARNAGRCPRCAQRVYTARIVGTDERVTIDGRDRYFRPRDLKGREKPRIYIDSLMPGFVEPALAEDMRQRADGRRGPFRVPHSAVCGR